MKLLQSSNYAISKTGVDVEQGRESRAQKPNIGIGDLPALFIGLKLGKVSEVLHFYHKARL